MGADGATRIGSVRTIRIFAAIAALTALAVTSPACAESAFAPTRVNGDAGSSTPIAGWQIQSSAKAQESGAEVSSPGLATGDWYPVSGRATVMAGLLENGKYENVFYSDNLRAAAEPDSSGDVFVIPWWYRTEFTLVEGGRETRTLLRINGMIASADVWLNGNPVAEQAAIAGAYPVHELDVTRWVHAGINILALRVHPADPRSSLSIGWVDWNPTPPDNNMGPWRGVDIVRTGPVEIRFPQVTSTLSLPDLARGAHRESGGAKRRCVGTRRNDHGRRRWRFAEADDPPRSRSDADRVLFPQDRSGPRPQPSAGLVADRNGCASALHFADVCCR